LARPFRQGAGLAKSPDPPAAARSAPVDKVRVALDPESAPHPFQRCLIRLPAARPDAGPHAEGSRRVGEIRGHLCQDAGGQRL
jgi:hypothetical protein